MIEIFDFRTDADRNVIIRPELRGRFLWLEPAPAPPQHSHDIAGEAFLVLEGRCEFRIEDELAVAGPGQLIYVDKNVRHAMRAIDGPCAMYLSVTPHVEPTHTFYDAHGERELPIRYDAWRGGRLPDGSGTPGRVSKDGDFDDGTTVIGFRSAVALLKQTAAAADNEAARYRETVMRALGDGDRDAIRLATDEMWTRMKGLLDDVASLETAWNRAAEHAMDDANQSTTGDDA